MVARPNLYNVKNFNVSRREIIIFIVIVCVLGTGILTVAWFRSGGALFSSSIDIVETSNTGPVVPSAKNISVANITPTSVTINWQVSPDMPVRIEYGVQQNQLDGRIDIPAGTYTFELSTLVPRVRYFFHIIANPGSTFSTVSPTYSFVTPVR